MITNNRDLRKAMRSLTDMKGLDRVAIWWNGSLVLPYAFESDVRAMQVLVYKGEINASDVEIVEYYDTIDNHIEHVIKILPKGCLSEPFVTPFFSKNDDLVDMMFFS